MSAPTVSLLLTFLLVKESYIPKLGESWKARAEGNEEIEDRIPEELDKIWFALSDEEQGVVNGGFYRRGYWREMRAIGSFNSFSEGFTND